MRLSAVLFDHAKNLWDEAAAKPFVVDMAKGVLEKQRYRYYMIQDYLYLLDYIDILKNIWERTDDPGTKDFLRFAIEQTKKETVQVHVPHMRELGIREEDALRYQKSPEIIDYVNYMMNLVKDEGVLAGLAALLQCSWVYAFIGERMMEKYPKEIAASPYKGWFAAYAGEDYLAANRRWIDVLDDASECEEALQGGEIDREEVKKLCKIFCTCAEYENRFWDMLYA